MAGESPDKVKQRESSGETTPEHKEVPDGSGPGDGTPADPRAAFVARSGEAAGTGPEGAAGDGDDSAEDSAPARIDQPTAVFTAPRADEYEDEDEGTPEAGDPAADGESTDPAEGAGGAKDAGEGDARLRATVAAWVSGEQPESASKAEAEAEPDEKPQAASAEAKPDPEAESEAESEADEKPKSTSAGQDDDASPEVEPRKPLDQPTATFRTTPKPKADPDPAPDPDAEADEEPKAADGRPVREPAGQDDDASPEVEPKKPLDQPTTTFRTTPKPEADPAPAPDPEPEPEPEAERTSQFVPLRSADLPPKPATAPPPPPPAAPPTQAAGETPEVERTRQQPMPPDAEPLDLLARLTNKPAPPETPLRTLVRRVKIWTPLVGLLALLFVVAQLLRPLPDPELDLTAAQTHSFDGAKPSVAWPDSGQAALEIDGLGSLGTSGEQKPVPIASVAKTMTAYIMLRGHPMKPGEDGKPIKVDKKAEDDAGLSEQGESTVDVLEGETLTEAEALNAIMVASANNVARLVARWDTKSDSEEEFVKKMNDTAKELGMKNTTYTDPSGLRKETVSTAEDQVKLGRAAMKIEAFRETVKLPSYKDRNGDKQENWNRLVPYDGVGIKTGTTTAAGGNLLFAAEQEIGGTTQLIIGAVLTQPPAAEDNSILTEAVDASRKLINSAQEALTSEKIVTKGEVVGQVDDGLGGRTPVIATKDVTAVGWPGLKVGLDLTGDDKTIPNEAAAGTRIGTLTVGGGAGQVKVPVELQEELTSPGAGAKITRIL